ncbi:Yip1 family protein [soil metagenome]
MSIVQRARNILLEPKSTWPVIAAEPATAQSIYVPYVLVLAAIPAVAGLLGSGFRTVVGAVVTYIVTLVLIYVLSLIVNALAPTFGGTKDAIAALKLVAYGSTASFLGGIFALIQEAWILGLFASIYSLYVIYMGLPVLMKCPPAKAPAYLAVIVVSMIVVSYVLMALTGTLMLGGPGVV